MKANNLSICIPYKGCDKDCQYCISKMTGYMKSDEPLFFHNLVKARKLADVTGVTSVSITGKGEPTLNLSSIRGVCSYFKDHSIELQTNGLKLKESALYDYDLIKVLSGLGIDIFAISMDRISDFEDMKEVISEIKSYGKLVRITLNVTDMLPDPRVFSFTDYISLCQEVGVDQFSLRQITIANNTERNETHEWIEKHAENNKYYQLLIKQFSDNAYSYQFIRALPYGAKLYDVNGISFTYFNYCIQDSSNGEDIRSLIYDEQGHLGTSWVSKAGRIF